MVHFKVFHNFPQLAQDSYLPPTITNLFCNKWRVSPLSEPRHAVVTSYNLIILLYIYDHLILIFCYLHSSGVNFLLKCVNVMSLQQENNEKITTQVQILGGHMYAG